MNVAALKQMSEYFNSPLIIIKFEQKKAPVIWSTDVQFHDFCFQIIKSR